MTSPDRLNDDELDDVQGAAAPKLMEKLSNGEIIKSSNRAMITGAADSDGSDEIKIEFQFYRPSHGHS